MASHELKCWPEPFKAIWRGEKTFEVRKDDRGFSVDDELLLRCYDPGSNEYTGQTIRARVCHLVKGSWGLPHDVCVMGLSHLSRDDEAW